MNTDDEHVTNPPLPPEIPVVPAGPLWTSLLVPPLATVASGVMMSFMGRTPMDMPLIFLPSIDAILVLSFSFLFHDSVRKRYRGTSLAYLVCCYVMGQLIFCIALWFGSCLLASAIS